MLKPMYALGIVALSTAIVMVQATASNLSKWFPCPQFENLSCAYFDIPLDYHNKSSGRGQLLVVKANATTTLREGTIFLNPGATSYDNLFSL